MLKKSISYEDYNGNSVTEDFYFNFTKLELMELDIRFEGGLEGHIKKLTEAENAREAYFLFKDVVLEAYGKKSDDGKKFVKNALIREDFEASPALGELIFEFIQNPAEGARFMEACLPSKLVAEAKEANAKRETQPPLPLTTEDKFGLLQKDLVEMSREELLELLQKNSKKNVEQ